MAVDHPNFGTFCSICYRGMTPETCVVDEDGVKWDICPGICAEQAGVKLPPHRYLSTGCLHGEHDYCKGETGAVGAKQPAECKFCEAPCICGCHVEVNAAMEVTKEGR